MSFKNVSPEVLQVPVISTAHMPSSDALTELGREEFAPVMVWEYGGLLYVDGIESQWVRDIVAKLDIPDDWVRFDAAGPVVDGLPVFYW
jgi:hypothetical protein